LSVTIKTISPSVFAISPSIVRQEIQDSLYDLYKIDDTHQTITRLGYNTEKNMILDDSIDINRVSYFSDGKVLNATLWLTYGFNQTWLLENSGIVSFGMLVDVNPNPAIGVGGVNYHKEIQYPSPPDLPFKYISWTEDTHEALSSGEHRYLRIEHNYNYTKLFQQELNNSAYGLAHYIPMSLDLNLLVSPNRYKVMFYTLAYTNNSRIIDFTSWIDIPPPRFNISTSSPVELRPDQTQNVGIVLKSMAGFLPPRVISFTNLESHSGIQVMLPKGKLNEVANSAAPIPVNITIPHNTQVGEYTIPIQAMISSGSSIPREFIGAKTYNSYVPPESFTNTTADLTVKVLEPLSFSQWFKEEWSVYGGVISLVAGGFTAGVASLLFDRLRNRNKNNGNQNTKISSGLNNLDKKSGSPFN